jgi:hypothetical protein
MIGDTKGVTKWLKRITMKVCEPAFGLVKGLDASTFSCRAPRNAPGRAHAQRKNVVVKRPVLGVAKLMVSHLSSRCVVTARRDNGE